MQKLPEPPIRVIGMEPEGLDTRDPRFTGSFSTCRFLAGGVRHLEALSGPLPDQVQRFEIRADLDSLVRHLKEFETAFQKEEETRGCAIVLASGDPLYYGIGTRLLKDLSPSALRFYPATTLVQRAFALLRVPWEQARVGSIHSRNADTISPLLENGGTLAFYTNGSGGPSSILGLLLQSGKTPSRFWVVENIGLPGENVHDFSPETLENIKTTSFSALNIVVMTLEK
ncbi:MAG: precorrin-6y C5,15-methyltransferase (decarboxylating) subunit CbiE [Leptospirales bacterium]